MRRIRPTTLTLPSGVQIGLTFATCLQCRRLVGTCIDDAPHIWDAIGFTQAAQLRFDDHTCPPERRRRDLARDSKMQADREARP